MHLQPPSTAAGAPDVNAWSQGTLQTDSLDPDLSRDGGTFDQPFSRALAASSFASMPGDSVSTETVGEGQESMIWFDQLFANAFGAIEYPVLASAQFDPSIDPSWQ